MLEDLLRKRYQFLTKSQKKVAEFFLAQGEDAAFLAISNLARQIKTSESTILRFARSIGYQGYMDLQRDLQGWIRQKISPPQVLQKAIAKESGQDIYAKIIEMDIHNIRETQKANSRETIDRAVGEIIEARRVGFTGFRSSHPLAYLLCFFLGQVRKSCEFLNIGMDNLPHQLISYGAKDLLIGVSFPRYAAPTLRILEYGKKAGCRILVITDNPLSPIGQISDLVLVAGNKSSTYFNSFSSAVTIINCLVAGVSLKSKHSVGILKEVGQIVDAWRFLLI